MERDSNAGDQIGLGALIIGAIAIVGFCLVYIQHIGNAIESASSNLNRIDTNLAVLESSTEKLDRTLEKINKQLEDLKYLTVIGYDDEKYNAIYIRREMNLDKSKFDSMK